MARKASIKRKLLAYFAMVISLELLTLGAIHLYHHKVVAFTKDQEEAREVRRRIEDYLNRMHDIPAGLFMMAAGKHGQGRARVLEAELELSRLERSFADIDWDRQSVTAHALEHVTEIAGKLVAEARNTTDLVTRLHGMHMSLGERNTLDDELALSLSRVSTISDHADLYTASLTDLMRKAAEDSAGRGVTLVRTMQVFTAFGGLSTTVLAVFVSLLFARSVARRLSDLESATRAFGKGDFSRRADVGNADELGKLAASFNRMAEELQAKTELLLSKEYVEKIMDTMTNCLFVINSDREIERVNRASCQLLGYDEDELIGRRIDMLMAAAEGGESEVSCRLGRESLQHAESVLQARDERRIPVSLSSAVMEVVDKSARTVCVAEDITERKELIDELVAAKQGAETADRAKSAFLASMSHELRTPLNGILGYAQILLRDRALTVRQRDSIETMRRSGEHLLTLLNDILDLSKIESGRMELHPSEFHFGRFLGNIVDIFKIQAAEKQIQFLYEPLSELPTAVRGDERRLRQILINLLGNAIKFTSRGGVVLKVGIHYGRIRFQVEDTGRGIAEDELEEIFAPFRQVGTQRGHMEGTGLGLAITRRLATMMDSELMVRSEPGKGSSFWLDIDLPRVAGWEDGKGESDRVILGYEGRRRRVLIVDDKSENLAVLDEVLTPLGFEITRAKNGRQAITTAGEWRPDIILMDVRMPVLDGLAATRELRTIPDLQGVVIIAVSASAFEENRQQSIAAGCDDFITKPVRIDALLAKIAGHLGLTWLYEKPPEEPVEEENDDGDRVIPESEMLEALYQLAEMGDIRGLRVEISRLGDSDDRYAWFCGEVGTLAKRFQINQIRELLKSHLAG